MKRFRTLTICAAAALLAFGLAACSSSSGSSGQQADSSPSATSKPAADTSTAPASAPAADVSQDTSSATAPADASTSPSGGEGFDFVDECTDEHGNISLYALAELKGWQVATLLDQQEYSWELESANTWTRTHDGAAFRATNDNGSYTLDTYNEMNEKGGCIAGIAYSVVAGYPDSQAALSGNAQCVVENSHFREDGSGIAIFYGPSMKEYLAVISPYTESTALFTIFSQEAVGSGMADNALGIETGGSFQAFWDKFVAGE